MAARFAAREVSSITVAEIAAAISIVIGDAPSDVDFDRVRQRLLGDGRKTA